MILKLKPFFQCIPLPWVYVWTTWMKAHTHINSFVCIKFPTTKITDRIRSALRFAESSIGFVQPPRSYFYVHILFANLCFVHYYVTHTVYFAIYCCRFWVLHYSYYFRFDFFNCLFRLGLSFVLNWRWSVFCLATVTDFHLTRIFCTTKNCD